ncbi:MAG TPA: FliM/FliN family flagellar motor switch protein [Opitutaceae bacterium]|nr:FliM/FliN family flagellar motor switch protein [Opitutaceae bacterium]
MAENPQNAAPTLLDQSEIDKLLEQTSEATAAKPLILRAGGERRALGAGVKVEPYDFRNPVFLTEGELRRVRLLYEDFVRYLGARLSLYLRMEFGLEIAKLTTVTYSKFTESLPHPTHISLFKIEPLAGVGVLDVNPRLALSIVDRLLGGRGTAVNGDRLLSEIDVASMEDVVVILLEEWCAIWKTEQELHPIIVGHENNGRFLQTSSKDAILLVMTLEAKFGDCTEQIQMGVPYYTIEPMVKKMHARRHKEATVSRVEKKSVWQGSYDRITIPVRAEWQNLELSLREITHLRVGDVIEMPPAIFSDTRVLLNGTPKFIGTVGLDTDRVAVQLTRKLPNEDIPHAKPDGRKNS